MKTSSETLRDLLDIQIKMSVEKAKKLLLEGKLPNNVFVDGSLFLTDTYITSLPDNLQVSRDLILRETKITSLPADISVGGDVYSSLKLKGKKPKGVKGKRLVR